MTDEIINQKNTNRGRTPFGGLISKIGGDTPLLLGGVVLAGLLSDQLIDAYQHNQLRNQVPEAVAECESGQYFQTGSDQHIAVSNYLVPFALAQYGAELGIDAIADINPELAGYIESQRGYLEANQITPSDVSIAGHAFSQVDEIPECLETLAKYTGQYHY